MRTIIIEDEMPAAVYLGSLLAKLAPDVEIVGVIDNVKAAVEWLKNNQADLIFLDIHLGDDNSFSIFSQIKIDTPIIFTTAYDEYALRAFKLNSIDYLLKPFTEDDLKAALKKFSKQQKTAAVDIQGIIEAMNINRQWQERFMVVAGQKIKSIPVTDIAYFLSEGRYVKLVTKSGEGYLLDQSLENLEQKTDPKLFFRVNRQALVRFESIKQMVVWSKSRVKLELEPKAEFDIIVSIDKSGEFKRWLNR
jgi:two-component system response regulator LytT